MDKSQKTCLIIGYGSIGARHAHILHALGHNIVCVSSRTDAPFPTYDSIEKALEKENPEIVAICSPTARHGQDLAKLLKLGFKGRMLLEKPAFSQSSEMDAVPDFPAYVGYDLRFHPVAQKIHNLLQNRKIYSLQLAVGQYLPTWRPGTDYRKCYSASKVQGGGVLRDLSHELDLALWFCGDWEKVTAIIGRHGKLEIDSDDTADILGQFKRCPSVSIHLDYHNMFAFRTIRAQCEDMSIYGDLIKNTLRVNDVFEECENSRNNPYELQWREILDNSPEHICSFEDGMKTMHLLEAAEQASISNAWISNKSHTINDN